MDRRPEAAPAQDAQGLLPIICWASDSVLAAVGGYLAGEAGQNDGNDNQERVAGEAEDNGSQGAAAGGLAGGNQDAPEVSGNDGAGVEPDAVVAIGGRENGQIAAGALEEGQGVGEEGQESGEVVVAIENGAGHAGASGAARDKEAYGREGRREAVVHQNATDGRIAGAAGEIVVDEHEEEAVAVVRAELRWPVMDNVLEAVRRRPLRALLLTSVFSGALFVPLTLWGISRDLMNVGQGQVALLRFGGGGAMGAINNFSNDASITGLRFTGVMAMEGKQSGKFKIDVKLDKTDNVGSTRNSEGVTLGNKRWPAFWGGKEGAGGKGAAAVVNTKKKGDDVEPKRRRFGREVGRLDEPKDGQRKRLERESRGQSQGAGESDDDHFASGGSVLSRVRRFFVVIGLWLREDRSQADDVFMEAWVD